MAPVIGVTATLKQDLEQRDTRPLGTYVRADLDYVSGVAEAGGVPMVLPPFAEYAEEMVLGIDGLLLSGGSDLDPRFYGEAAIPELDTTLPQRDEFEMVLLEHALKRGLPVFGICRGLQVLNVAFGGTLYQDLPSQVNPALIAHRQLSPKWEWTHEVEMDEGSAMRRIMDVPRTRVNSYHHQAIKDLAEPFRAVGRSVDGIVEAIEHRDLSERWIVAVQWHAEAMREGDVGPEHRNLFRAHVAAAERHALKRAAA